jgi:hypothetical protein
VRLVQQIFDLGLSFFAGCMLHVHREKNDRDGRAMASLGSSRQNDLPIELPGLIFHDTSL